MIKKIGILILIGIISMCTVIPIALADNNDDQDVDDIIMPDKIKFTTPPTEKERKILHEIDPTGMAIGK
ncbi:unnamed protein product [marine sediment metagenome]|uniref:Uncharacterized protein n=1 Tax=marine sediment metagenome TaxID=412755 RepID=X1E316_9ZZZZ